MADTYIGRYRAIRYSMWIMWIASVLATFSELMAQGITWYSTHSCTVLYILAVVAAIGFSGFQSNSVQFGITQLSNASTVEITSFITWYIMTLYISDVTLQVVTNCILPDAPDSLYIKTFAVALLLTIALALDFLFHSCLAKEQPTGKPLSLIFSVVKFSMKHRHSIRSEYETPSRLNVAKRIYGGPFMNQQVEDVKSMLRIVALIAICAILCAAILPVEYAIKKIEYNLMKWTKLNGLIIGCYERLSVKYNDFFFIVGIVILYEFVVYPLFHKCLPRLRITSQFLLGIVLFLFRILALIGIETGIHYTTQNMTKCIFTQGLDSDSNVEISYKWLLIPGFTGGLSTFLFLLSAIQFVWAQTPYFMTGLVFGIMYAFLALYILIHLAIGSPFLFIDSVPWDHYPLTCGIWYFVMQAVIVLVALIVGFIAVKKYKGRTRHDSVTPLLSSNLHEDTAINQGPFC